MPNPTFSPAFPDRPFLRLYQRDDTGELFSWDDSGDQMIPMGPSSSSAPVSSQALSAQVENLTGRVGALEQKVTLLQNTSSTTPQPGAPSTLTAPTISFPGGSPDSGETATITPGSAAAGATITLKEYQWKINGQLVGVRFTNLDPLVPSEVAIAPNAVSVIEYLHWSGGVVENPSQTYTANPAQQTIATSILNKVAAWWEFEDSGEATTFIDRKGTYHCLVGNGKNNLQMSTATGDRDRGGRFGTNGPHSDFFYVAGSGDGSIFDAADTAFAFGGKFAMRQSISNSVDRFIWGRQIGISNGTLASVALWWHAGGGVNAQTFKLVVCTAGGAQTELVCDTTFTPSAGLAYAYVACWHDPAANLIYLRVNGVTKSVAFAGGPSGNNTALWSWGNGVTAAGAIWDNTYSMAYDCDSCWYMPGAFPTTAEHDMMATAGNCWDEIVTIAGAAPPAPAPAPSPSPAPAPTPPSSRNWFLTPHPVTARHNTPIPSNATWSTASDARTIAIRSPSSMVFATQSFTQWVWQATVNDPFIEVDVDPHYTSDDGGVSMSGSPGSTTVVNNHAGRGTVTIRLPAGSHPDPGRVMPQHSVPIASDPWSARVDGGPYSGSGPVAHSYDAHFTVIDPDGKTAHQFWHIWRNRSGRYRAVSYARIPLDTASGSAICGAGVSRDFGQFDNPNFFTLGWSSQRADGGDGLRGLIRAGEFTQGLGAEHALAVLLMAGDGGILKYDGNFGNQTEGVNFKKPATRADTQGRATKSIVMGQWFGLHPNTTASGIGVTSAVGVRLVYTLKKYGLFAVDATGGVGFNYNVDGVAAAADGAALSALSGAEKTAIKNNLLAVDFA